MRAYYTVAFATAAAIIAVGAACNKGPANASGMTASGDGAATTTASANGDAAMSPAGGGAIGDPQIFALLSELNMGEIQAAKLAADKSKNPAVKSFAQKMIHDHTKMLNKGDSLATALKISPTAPAPDSVAAKGQAEQSNLNAAAPGGDFDKQYMDAQVADHEMTLAFLQQFQGQTQNADIKSLLSGAIPIVQGHLARAKKIDAQVGGQTQS
jgi:putative membrane protein